MEDHRINRIIMALKRLQFLAAEWIPDSDRAIHARRCQSVPLTVEGHTQHAARMPFEHLQLFTRGCVPDCDRAVVTCRSQPTAVGTKGNVRDVSARRLK